MSTHQNRIGNYVGICNNETARLSANLVFFLHGITGSRVHGELALSGDLGGGGPFHGTMTGDLLSFSTCEPAVQLLIEWKARFDGEGLSGRYECFCDQPEAEAQGIKHQRGNWSCQLVRGVGEIDQSRVDLVWVFHEGQSYGPFPITDFARDVQSGQWPLGAVVALDDLTTFCSVAELLAFLESQQAASPQQPTFGGEVVRETGKKVIAGVLATVVLAAFGIGND